MTKKSLSFVLLSPPALVLLLVLVLTVLAPWVAPSDPNAQDLAQRLQSPSWGHLLGTDSLGRDILSRVLHGGRFSLSVALLTTLFSLSVGTVLGLLSALRGGWLDEFFMRANDLLLALPEIVVALLVIAIMGPGFSSMVFAVGVVSWTPTARLVRSLAVQVLSTGYVEASRHVGSSRWFILRHHVLPFLAGPVLAQTALRFGLLLVLLGSLSYLGIGVQPPQSDWGSMLAEAQPHAIRSPWSLIAPGAAIFMVSFCVTLVGNRLTQWFNGHDVLEPAGQEQARG
ncbi:MAG: ABC transporter permease [Paeniglutamicibacter terrestris]